MTYSPLAPQYTEAVIKSVLDGTFTRVTLEGNVITDSVSPGFLPGHSGHKVYKPTVPWSKDDDDILLRMRLLNRPFAEIGWTLDRSEESTRKRYQSLRVNGKVMV